MYKWKLLPSSQSTRQLTLLVQFKQIVCARKGCEWTRLFLEKILSCFLVSGDFDILDVHRL
jgi:hypothetical protein